MAFLLPFVPLITAGAAATSAGLGIYNAVNQPGAPKAPSPADVTKNAIADETSRRDAAGKSAAQVLPGLQYQTSGGLSPDAYQTFGADFSGNADLAGSQQMKDLVAKFLGTDNGFGGGTFGGNTSPSSPGLTG